MHASADITKAKGGQRRTTKAYERILADVPKEIGAYLDSFSPEDVTASHLGDVPNLYSLVPLAQSVNAPIIDLKARDGLVGNQFSQAAAYRGIIGHLAEEIAGRVAN